MSGIPSRIGAVSEVGYKSLKILQLVQQPHGVPDTQVPQGDPSIHQEEKIVHHQQKPWSSSMTGLVGWWRRVEKEGEKEGIAKEKEEKKEEEKKNDCQD